ncbi:MAG: hypothetical protein ACHQLQ_02325 [Candidatus Acidiferrales bacterium]
MKPESTSQDAGLLDKNGRDPHKPGESPALHGQEDGKMNSPLQQEKAHSQEWLCHMWPENEGQSWDSMALEISS